MPPYGPTLLATIALLLLGLSPLALPHAPAGAPPAAASGPGPLSTFTCATATYGTHSYKTCRIGHPAETALASGANGLVWALSDLRPLKTSNAGSSWIEVSLAPIGNSEIAVVPEGDIQVAPNGDILTVWLDPGQPHTAPLWISTDGGASFNERLTASGPNPAPDRPWIMTGATEPVSTDPLVGVPYSTLVNAGTGAKINYVSPDRGTTWYTMLVPLSPVLAPLTAFPALGANAYMDYAKPLAQGDPTDLLALPSGEFVDLNGHRFTRDFLQWNSFGAAGWPTAGPQHWFDSGSDGKLWFVQIAQVSGTWTVSYKFYNGSWHNGNATQTLTAQPDFPLGLSVSGGPASHDVLAAVKSHGTTLAVNTRQGLQDVLVRFANADAASPTATKELIGPGGNANKRYDFPNLVFDSSGRAVASFDSDGVAYAQTV